MRTKQFKKLLKIYKSDLQALIYLHTIGKRFLTSEQLDIVITLRGERKYPHYEIKEGRQVITW